MKNSKIPIINTLKESQSIKVSLKMENSFRYYHPLLKHTIAQGTYVPFFILIKNWINMYFYFKGC